MREVFDLAKRRILLTDTPFRSVMSSIPFVRYVIGARRYPALDERFHLMVIPRHYVPELFAWCSSCRIAVPCTGALRSLTRSPRGWEIGRSG